MAQGQALHGGHLSKNVNAIEHVEEVVRSSLKHQFSNKDGCFKSH